MQQTLAEELFPVFTLELDKNEVRLADVDAIIAYLKTHIVNHPLARFIATFDHLQHTQSLADGQADENILAAKNIVFCFGITLQDPRAMAFRPRSIGVADIGESYIITFMETPMPVANATMENWVKSIPTINISSEKEEVSA